MSYPSYDELRKGVKHYMAELEKEKKRSKVLVVTLENIKQVTPKKGAVNEWCRTALKKFEEMK